MERTVKVVEHAREAGIRFTAFVSPEVIQDKEVDRRLKELAAADRLTLVPQSSGRRTDMRFDATLVPSEFWLPALGRARAAGVRAPAFIEFHQLPYVGTLDVLKTRGVQDPSLLDIARLPLVSSRILGDQIPFFAFQTGACYLSVRSLGRRRDAQVMAVTPVTRKNLAAFGYRGATFVPRVHVGMEPEHFANGSEAAETTEYDAVYVGRFHPHKGFLDLPAIAAHLRKALSPDVRIAVCGSPQFARHLKIFEDRVAAYGVEKNLVMLRWLSRADLYRTIRRSRALLYPSYVDAFSITVLESLCLGVPVVAYAIDALEMIWGSRTGVFLSAVGDPKGIAERCAALITTGQLDEARRRMPEQSRRLLKEYTWPEVVRWERRFLDRVPAGDGGTVP